MLGQGRRYEGREEEASRSQAAGHRGEGGADEIREISRRNETPPQVHFQIVSD